MMTKLEGHVQESGCESNGETWNDFKQERDTIGFAFQKNHSGFSVRELNQRETIFMKGKSEAQPEARCGSGFERGKKFDIQKVELRTLGNRLIVDKGQSGVKEDS